LRRPNSTPSRKRAGPAHGFGTQFLDYIATVSDQRERGTLLFLAAPKDEKAWGETVAEDPVSIRLFARIGQPETEAEAGLIGIKAAFAEGGGGLGEFLEGALMNITQRAQVLAGLVLHFAQFASRGGGALGAGQKQRQGVDGRLDQVPVVSRVEVVSAERGAEDEIGAAKEARREFRRDGAFQAWHGREIIHGGLASNDPGMAENHGRIGRFIAHGPGEGLLDVHAGGGA
jgi:hypothetical protein